MIKKTLIVLGLVLILCAPVVFAGLYSDKPLEIVPLRLIAVISFTLFICSFSYFSRRIYVTLIQSVVLFVCFLMTLTEAACFYMTGKSFEFSFWTHLSPGTLIHGGASSFRTQLIIAGISVILVIGLLIILLRLLRTKVSHSKTKVKTLIISILSLVTLLTTLFLYNSFPPAIFGTGYYHYLNTPEIKYNPHELEKLGINTHLVPQSKEIAIKGKNLVYIFLESIEGTYLDQKLFPALIPNIENYANKESINFSGVHEAMNATFTLGGMFAQLTGGILSDHHIIGDGLANWNGGYNPNVAQLLPTIPETLNIAGYHQVFMRGASLEFAGTNLLLKKLKYDEMYDLKHYGLNVNDPKKFGMWGAHDNTLFDEAYKKYEELCKQNKPFNLTILTVDSHHPDGFPIPGGLKYKDGKVNLLNAIHDTDHLLKEFIDKLKDSSKWKDTIVVVTNDHLAMMNTVHKQLIKSKDRKMLFFALNAGKPRDISTPGASFDIGPTVLDLMKVKTNIKFPIGQDLLKHNLNKERLRWDSEKLSNWDAYCEHFTTTEIHGKNSNIHISVVGGDKPKIKVDKQTVPVTITTDGDQGIPGDDMLFVLTLSPRGELINSGLKFIKDNVKGYFSNKFNSYIVFAREGAIHKTVNPRSKELNPNGHDYVLMYGKLNHWKLIKSTDLNKLSLDINKR